MTAGDVGLFAAAFAACLTLYGAVELWLCWRSDPRKITRFFF